MRKPGEKKLSTAKLFKMLNEMAGKRLKGMYGELSWQETSRDKSGAMEAFRIINELCVVAPLLPEVCDYFDEYNLRILDDKPKSPHLYDEGEWYITEFYLSKAFGWNTMVCRAVIEAFESYDLIACWYTELAE